MVGLRVAGGGRWVVGALAGVLALPFVLSAVGPAYATGERAETLRLDRSDGPPGTEVVATVRGYAECHAAGTTNAEGGGGEVKIFWEGFKDAVGSAVVPSDGVVEVPFSVPAGATAQKYSIVSLCMTNSQLTDDDQFVVTGSKTSVVVPPVTPRTPSVQPSTVVPSETATPETTAPQLVRVPRVVGLKVADAEAKVSALGLVTRVTSGDGDVVTGQSPSVGSMVGAGHVVRIVVEPAAAAPAPNPVTEPPAGADSAPSAELFPWSSAVLLSLGVLAFAAVTYRVGRLRLDRRWVRDKLRIVVPPAPAVDARVMESDPAPPTMVVRIQPHDDAGIHVLQEG